MTLDSLIEKLTELNEKRSKGKWVWCEKYREVQALQPHENEQTIIKTDGGVYPPEKQDREYICELVNASEVLLKVIKLQREALMDAEKCLDSIKAELNGGVYSVEKDEFGSVYYVRDAINEALEQTDKLVKDLEWVTSGSASTANQ